MSTEQTENALAFETWAGRLFWVAFGVLALGGAAAIVVMFWRLALATGCGS